MKLLDNPPNPFESAHREYFEGMVPPAKLQVYEDATRNILSENKSPDLGFRWSLNPYRGCAHACAYCLSGDTPIAMTNGRTKPLADIRIGDEIYGTALRGKYHYFVKTHVLAHWSVVKPAYRIILEDGTQLVASAGHRFLTSRGWKYVTGTQHGRTRRPHLTTRNELLGTGKSAEPPEEGREYQQGYLCGLIRGDGLLASYSYDGRRRTKDTQHHFRLALIDTEALHRARQYLSAFEVPTHELLFQRAVPGYEPVYAIRTHARPHVERVRKLVEWPLSASLDWRKGFLAGIFDAEGSYSRGILRICNTDHAIIDHITDSLKELNFDYATESTPGDNKPVHVVRVRGGLKEHLRFFQTVDSAITRKKDITGQAIKNKAPLRVSAIEPLGVSLPLFDITTGTGDFIANGVVSHNCYARPTHEYLGFGAGTDFETKIVVKIKAPELLRQTFMKRPWKGELIIFSGDTDCYQPLEAHYQLTRRCLEVCLDFGNPVSLITKSFLMIRDLELLKKLHERTHLGIMVSIPFSDEKMARLVEPNAASIEKRFESVQKLSQAGIRVSVNVAPVIPGLNDSDIPRILKQAKQCGARGAGMTLLRLPGSVKDVFISRIQTHFPLATEKILGRIREVRDGRLYNSQFGKRRSGEGPYWENIRKIFDVYCEKLSLNQECPEEIRPPFRRPGLQRELFV